MAVRGRLLGVDAKAFALAVIDTDRVVHSRFRWMEHDEIVSESLQASPGFQ